MLPQQPLYLLVWKKKQRIVDKRDRNENKYFFNVLYSKIGGKSGHATLWMMLFPIQYDNIVEVKHTRFVYVWLSKRTKD